MSLLAFQRGRTATLFTGMVGEGLLYVLVAFLPWAFGAVEAWSEAVVALLAAALAVCMMVHAASQKQAIAVPRVMVPLLVLGGVAAFSVIPLPVAWLGWLSPRTVAIQRELLAHLGTEQNRGTATLSLYPAATAGMLRLFLCSAIAFLAVVHFCRTRDAVLRLLAVIAAVGGLLAMQALLQDATGDGRIYWSIAAPVKSTSGPFVNYNNFCQYMNLSLGAAIALFLVCAGSGSGPRCLSKWIGHLAAILLLGGLAIVLSTSRGGVFSMIAGGLAAVAILVARGKSTAPLKLLAILGMAVVLGAVTIGVETLWDRMAALSDIQSASGARWRVASDVLAMLPQFPIFGIGLGTHEKVYPMFSHLSSWRNAQYIENEYLQMAEEMGIIGVGLMIWFASGMVRNLWIVLKQKGSDLSTAAVGLAYALVATSVACISDFGQRIASVSCLTAIICGLIVAIRRLEVPPTSEAVRRAARGQGLMVVVLGCGVLWMSFGVVRAAVAQYHWRQAMPLEAALVRKSWQGSDEEFARLVAEGRAATLWAPDNVEYACWSAIYEWHAFMQPTAWDKLSNEQRVERFAALLARFEACERQAPTYGLSYAMAGQIRAMGLEDSRGEEEIERAYRLAPTHPAVCFIAGRLKASQGNWEGAREAFAAALSRRYSRSDILAVYLKGVHRPDLAAELFADDWQMLRTIAQSLEAGKSSPDLAEAIQSRAENVLRREARRPDAPVQTLAAMADLLHKQGALADAVIYFRRAIDADYAAPDLHLALSRLLADMGEDATSRQEAAIASRLRQK